VRPREAGEVPEGWRVALVATAAVLLFVAVSTIARWDDPYGPNDWAFTHTFLADLALCTGELPVNWGLLEENSFAGTRGAFAEATGLPRMTYYAVTVWHFWNGLPFHPALVAAVSAFTGLSPEEVVRIPLGGILAVVLGYATASLLLARLQGAGARLAVAVPFLLAVGSAPFALDLRVTMPSVTLLAVLLLLHLMLRRALLGDRIALALGLAPLALLPFWYYTVSYFTILLFGGFLLFTVAARLRRVPLPTGVNVPVAACIVVPVFLVVVLAHNGALTSHLHMASLLAADNAVATAEAGSDYDSHLNRDLWRSLLLYAALGLLFLPLVAASLHVGWRLLRGEPLDPLGVLLAQWSLGGLLFSGLLLSTVGISFLNRTAIYLAPLAALAAVALAAHAWERPAVRRAFLAGGAALLVIAPLLVATAAPAYTRGDQEAFEWMADRVPRNATVYGSLEAASVLFRVHGFREVNAFQPTRAVLETFWYGENPEAIVPFLLSFEYVVMRDDARHTGFEEFGPAREPVSEAAYEKFSKSPDLQRLFDNGEVQVYQVAVKPERIDRGPRPPAAP